MKPNLLLTGLLFWATSMLHAQTKTWYADSDNDGFGDPTVIIIQAPKPAGYVLNNLDCNDELTNNPSWQPENTAGFTAGAAYQVAMAMGSGSTPYVVYRDFAHNEKATVLKFTGSGWATIGGVAFSAGKIAYPDIALDNSNTPYIAYSDRDSGDKVTVMKYNGSSWVTVGNRGFSAGKAEYISLVINASGVPFVVYRDIFNNGKATVMSFVGGNWVPLGAAGFSDYSARYTNIALDYLGTPFIVYQDAGFSSAVTVMKYDAGTWTAVGNAGFSAAPVRYTSLVLDDNSMPYVVYEDQGNASAATVKRYNGSNWVNVGNPGFSAGQVAYTSISLAADGTPYVAFSDYTAGNKATVMQYDGSNWVILGDPGFSAGAADHTNIAIDELGIPHVVYTDGANNNKATLMTVVPHLYTPTVSISTLSTTVCSKAQVVFNAAVTYEGTLPRYLWKVNGIVKDSGDTYTTSNLANGDMVTCTLISNGSCLLKDTAVSNALSMRVNPAPKVNLGADTSLCQGDTALLNAGIFTGYWWSTGENTPTIKAADLGIFFVTVADNAGCLGSDTIVVLVNDLPVIGLPGDTDICSGGEMVLDAGAGFDYYMWSTLENTQTISTKTAGTYRITVVDENGCKGKDSIEVSVKPAPFIGLKADTAICNGTATIIDAGPGFDNYTWSTTDTGRFLNVNTEGIYHVTATDAEGCEAIDSVIITVLPLPVVNLGNDTILCTGASLVLDAGAGFDTYQWSTGNSSRTITVQNAGTYSVNVHDNNGCEGADAIDVSLQSCTTGIGETRQDQVLLYPNPARDAFQLTFSQPGNVLITVLSPDGRILQSHDMNGTTAVIDIAGLSQGIYLVRIDSGTHTVLKRLIKQ